MEENASEDPRRLVFGVPLFFPTEQTLFFPTRQTLFFPTEETQYFPTKEQVHTGADYARPCSTTPTVISSGP
jgi:hypothetical protein